MLLNYIADSRGDVACRDVAGRIRDAYNACLTAGEMTPDLGGSLGSTEFTDAIIAKLGKAQ